MKVKCLCRLMNVKIIILPSRVNHCALILTCNIVNVVAATKFIERLRKSDEKCCGNFQSEKSPKKSFFHRRHDFPLALDQSIQL